jgi:hypothetical protein
MLHGYRSTNKTPIRNGTDAFLFYEVLKMSILLDIVIRDTLHKILKQPDMIEKLSEMVDIKPQTLESMKAYLDTDLNDFYKEFCLDE